MREGRAVAPSRRCGRVALLRDHCVRGRRSQQVRPSRVHLRSQQVRPSRIHLRSQRTATLPRPSPVAQERDPPACIFGRRGLRPSRMHSTFSVRSVPVAQERDPPEALHLYTSPRLKPTIHCHLPTAHYPHSKTGNRRIKNNVPPLLISTPGCCTIRAIFEQRRGFGHGVRGHSFLFSLFRKTIAPLSDLFLGKHCPWRANARRLGRNPQLPCAFH